MSCNLNSSDINQTFIVEPIFVAVSTPTITACTGVYTNTIVGCDYGNQIVLNSGSTIFSTSITAPMVNSYNLQLSNRIITYENQSGASLIGKFLSGTSNGFILSDISNIQGIDTYVTGGTFSSGTAIFTNNFGNKFSVTGFASIDTYVTGGTHNKVSGTTIFTNNFGNTFSVNGYFTGYTYTPEDKANKQNSMAYDGTGVKYPTVDAVNIQANTIARSITQTGFIDTSDGFTMYVANDNTLGISGSTIGIAFSQLFKTPPFTPSSAIVQLTSRLVPLSNIALSGDGSYVKFVGYRQSDDSIVFSDISFLQSPTVCQLGLVLVKYSGGTTSFIDADRTFINQPDISAYSNLETTGFGIKSSVIVDNNGVDLKIKNTGGSLIGISVNWHGNNNDLKPIDISSYTGTSFTYLYPGIALSPSPIPFVSNINPTKYWNGSILASVSGVSATTIQRFLVTIRGTVAVQYGEFVYNTFSDALNNASIQTFSDVLPMGTFAEVGRLVVMGTANNLSNTSQAVFITTGSGGGSIVNPTVIAWGNIGGKLSDQTDLQAALDGKQPLLTNPVIGTGATNTLPKFNSNSGLTNSQIIDNGPTIDIDNGALYYDKNGYAGAYPRFTFGTTKQESLFFNVQDTASFQIRRTGSSFGPQIRFGTALGTLSAQTNPNTNAVLGQISFEAYNGLFSGANTPVEGFQIAANIRGILAASATTTATSAHIYFGTVPTGSTTVIDRMVIRNNGNILIGTTTDNLVDKLQLNGTSRFNGTVNINIPSTAGTREQVFTAQISDSGSDLFGIANGTGVDGRFAPVFYNFSNANYGSLGFRALTTSSGDSGATPLITFQPFLTNSTTDPNNGVFSKVNNRPLMNMGDANGNPIFFFNSNGNFLINLNTSADTITDKLQISGSVFSTGGYKISGGTSSQFLMADGSVSSGVTNAIAGSGTTGQVAFFNSSNSISGSTGFTWDNTNQRLSIGGTGTGTKLALVDNIAGSAGSIFTVQNTNATSSTNFSLSNSAGGAFLFQASSSGYAIPNTGTVGITGSLTSLALITNGDVTSGGSAPIKFRAGGWNVSDTMTIIAGNPGRVLIGTSTDAGTNYRLQVNGNVTCSYLYPSGQIQFPNNGFGLGLDGNGTSYFKGYYGSRWDSDIKIKYVTDLSASYDARTLVDKGYVDARFGTGTTNYIPKFTSGNTIGNSRILDDGTYLGINTINPPTKDITLSYLSNNRNIGVEDSDSATIGKDLTLNAGRATNFSLNNNFVGLNQTFRAWRHIEQAPNGNIYVAVDTGDLYMQSGGTGSFNPLGQGIKAWNGIGIASNGNVYASAIGADIYLQSGGTGNFNPLGQGAKAWRDIAVAPNGNVYANVFTGDIYMQSGGVGNFNALGQTVRSWQGIACAPNGNVYATTSGGDIYMQSGGIGNFIPLGQTARNWVGITVTPNGDVYANVQGGDIYLQSGGTGNFVALGQTVRQWLGMGTTPTGEVYATVDSGDIYILQSSGVGTPDLNGGTLKLKAGTGKGAGQSRVQIITGAKTVSGTNMQLEQVVIEINESGNTVFNGLIIKSGGTSSQFLMADGSVSSGTTISEMIKNEFIYTSGPQTFTTSQNYSQVYSVSVQGGGPLKADQYTLSGSNTVTITDTLDSGDYIIILFTASVTGSLPYYTQSQVDSLLNLKMDKQRQPKIISTNTYSLLSSDSDKILYFTSSSAITMTIPSGLTLGNSYEVFQQGTGQISFTGDGITTIRYSSLELPMTAERYSLIGIDSIANVTEEYHLYGQLYPI